MIRGVTVQLMVRKETKRDDFNHPVYNLVPENVENVLISPTTSDDVVGAKMLEGKKVVYTLAIPKTDQHEWKDQIVILPAPWSGKWKVFGEPLQGIEKNIPLIWNKKVTVEKYE